MQLSGDHTPDPHLHRRISERSKTAESLQKNANSGKYVKLLCKNEHRHGFMRPFSKQQVATWIYFVVNLIH